MFEAYLRFTGVITFQYVNWRNEFSIRRVRPKRIRWGATEWHQEPQWLMSAYDFDKKEERDFAMKDMTAVNYYVDQQPG